MNNRVRDGNLPLSHPQDSGHFPFPGALSMTAEAVSYCATAPSSIKR